MERQLKVTEGYLYVPICVKEKEKKVEIFRKEDGKETKIYEFMVPAGERSWDYYAEVPLDTELLGSEIVVRADAPEAFLQEIQNEKKRVLKEKDRPLIHFTADTGWTNDPNGLIYANGVYHFYFQYNPFNIVWNNMTWGHATSKDLLHWRQEDSVMFPDESGTMFSGCAIANDRKLPGYSEDALVFCYTAAGGSNPWSEGKTFVQKMAYSLDGGKTLIKEKEACLPTLFEENRDPKIYWHEPTKGYVMALFLRGNEYGIFRSEDLKTWVQTDQFMIEEAWECPDLLLLTSSEGETCWFFWTSDGFYLAGEFDGYHFKAKGERHHAYVGSLPYAAQTYVGTPGRTVMIPWLRLENDGRMFTGSYGIPVELSCKKTPEGFRMLQMPVRELFEQAKAPKSGLAEEGGRISYQQTGERRALVFEMTTEKGYDKHYVFTINGSKVEYVPESGKLMVDDGKYQAGIEHEKFLLLVDDRILEIFFDDGIQMGAFPLKETAIKFETSKEGVASYRIYEVK